MKPETSPRQTAAGVALVLGAGLGLVIGVVMGGGDGVAVGAALGAGIGVVVGAARDGLRSRPSDPPADRS